MADHLLSELTKLLHEKVLQTVCTEHDRRFRVVVVVAVVENLSDVADELGESAVALFVQVALHLAQIHRVLDHIVVVRHLTLVHRSEERPGVLVQLNGLQELAQLLVVGRVQLLGVCIVDRTLRIAFRAQVDVDLFGLLAQQTDAFACARKEERRLVGLLARQSPIAMIRTPKNRKTSPTVVPFETRSRFALHVELRLVVRRSADAVQLTVVFVGGLLLLLFGRGFAGGLLLANRFHAVYRLLHDRLVGVQVAVDRGGLALGGW